MIEVEPEEMCYCDLSIDSVKCRKCLEYEVKRLTEAIWMAHEKLSWARFMPNESQATNALHGLLSAADEILQEGVHIHDTRVEKEAEFKRVADVLRAVREEDAE